MVTCVENPQARLVRDAERHRARERVAASLVESGADHLVNARTARTQRMRWSERGAFDMRQVRAAHDDQRLAQAPVAA